LRDHRGCGTTGDVTLPWRRRQNRAACALAEALRKFVLHSRQNAVEFFATT
jgi:hypothetical protein